MWIATRFLNKFKSSFQKSQLHSITKQVKDIVKLKGLKDNKPYIIIDGNRVNLPTDTFLANISLFRNTAYCAFFDIHYNSYFLGTPIERVLSQSFFIQANENFYFVYNNTSLISTPKSPIYEKTDGSYILQPIVTQTLRELEGAQFIERETLHNHMMKNVIDNSDQIKLQKLRYKELMKVVQAKISVFNDQIHIVEQKLKQKAQRRVRLFSTFLIAQIGILHYFIYFNLSWDIMEPVTVILGNVDLFVAYYFFLLKGQPYSPQTWKQSIVQRKRLKYLQKQGIDMNKYSQLLEIQSHLKMKLGLLSKNPLILMETVEKPFKNIDCR